MKNSLQKILIREAEKSEYAEVTDIAIKVWQQAYANIIEQGFLNNISFEQRLEGRFKWLSKPHKYSIVAICDQKITGFCDFGISRHPEYGKGEIYALYVLPEYQGRGIGTLLMKKAANRLEQEHLTSYIIITLEKNVAAQKFYEKLGFCFVTRILSQIGDHEYPEKVYLYNPHSLALRPTTLFDIPSLVNLSYAKRRYYEKAQPQFWKYAGSNAEKSQTQWFAELLTREDHILLTAASEGKIIGFIIGKLMQAPEVYNPGGLTLMIDDFCVETEADWAIFGRKLIEGIKKLAKARGATQILVVCGAHDEPKRSFLRSMGLIVASEWYVGSLKIKEKE